MASKTSDWLLKSPVEVIVLIASHLPTIDYCSLRRTCKHVESALFHAFATEFFKRRQFMLTEFSLQALIDISQSRLASSVEYVSLSTDKPRLDQFRNNSFRHARLDKYEQALQQNRFHEEYESHNALVTSGRDYAMLLEGLKNLPNLQALSLRDFQSIGRYRDGRDARWRPYGSTTFFQRTSIPTDSDTRLYRYQTGMGGPMHMSSPIEEAELLYLKHLLTTLLRLVGALAAEGPVSRFEVILRKLALSDGAFAMPGPVRGAILPAMTHLKALFLDLCTMAPPTMVEDSESGIRNSYNYHLLQLLASTENIEHLRINCKDPQSRIGVNELFTWLVAQSDEDAAKSLSSRQYPGLPQLPPPIGFPKLERIEIGFALLEADTLLDLFKKFKTSLQAINLHKINLAATREQQTDKVNLWARLLNGMAALDLSLTSIVLEEVGQGSESYRCLPVKFNSTTGQDRKMAWSGRATLHGLKDIHTALEIEFPEDEGMHPGVHMTDEDEDEEEFDDMDDVDDMDEGEGNDGDASGGDGD